MILKIFSIYDEKAKAYLPPFFLPQAGMALRTFADCVNSKDHQFGAHPQDYTINELGEFNDGTAEITISRATLGNGVEFIQTPRPENNNGQSQSTLGDAASVLADTESGHSTEQLRPLTRTQNDI